MKFSRKIAPEIKTSPKFLTKKRLKEDEIYAQSNKILFCAC